MALCDWIWSQFDAFGTCGQFNQANWMWFCYKRIPRCFLQWLHLLFVTNTTIQLGSLDQGIWISITNENWTQCATEALGMELVFTCYHHRACDYLKIKNFVFFFINFLIFLIFLGFYLRTLLAALTKAIPVVILTE